MTTPEPATHDPANGIFDWNGTDSPAGEFYATTVGSYVITYFQPREVGVRGSVQVYHGKDIQIAWTANARDLAQHCAERMARDPSAYVIMTIGSEWHPGRVTRPSSRTAQAMRR